MKRKYDISDFFKIINNFRKKIPKITISTDIIVGYPTETESDFRKTIKLIREVKPEVLNISAFSSRPGTVASRMKQLPSEVIKKRTRELNEVYRKYRKHINS